MATRPASSIRLLVAEAHRGNLYLLDAYGRFFGILDWKKVRPFGGIWAIPYLLRFSSFAIPVIGNGKQLSLDESKKIVLDIMKAQSGDQLDNDGHLEFSKRINEATSYIAVIETVANLLG
jgi:hypothetical protein